MSDQHILNRIKSGIIVSCQAHEEEPLHGSLFMSRMALAAEFGGAVAVRANGLQDIAAIKSLISIPVIGILKKNYNGFNVKITPTLNEVRQLVGAGVDVVAVDATLRKRPDGATVEEMIHSVKKSFPNVLLMADVSTLNEGVLASRSGADIVASTLSGYTTYSSSLDHADFALVEKLVRVLDVPVIAEGRIQTPTDAYQCFEKGAWAVVVGSAITRPQKITKNFVNHIKGFEYR